jgi:hypothetical protein
MIIVTLTRQGGKKNISMIYFSYGYDVPWEKDDLRDSPDNRKSVLKFLKASNKNKTFHNISG